MLGAQASPPAAVSSLVLVANAGRRGRLRSQQQTPHDDQKLLFGNWDVLLSFVA